MSFQGTGRCESLGIRCLRIGGRRSQCLQGCLRLRISSQRRDRKTNLVAGIPRKCLGQHLQEANGFLGTVTRLQKICRRIRVCIGIAADQRQSFEQGYRARCVVLVQIDGRKTKEVGRCQLPRIKSLLIDKSQNDSLRRFAQQVYGIPEVVGCRCTFRVLPPLRYKSCKAAICVGYSQVCT